MRQIFKFCPFCKNKLFPGMIEARKRLVCQKCGWINYGNPLPVALCAALNSNGEILVVRRNQPPGKNKWALPGGFIEANENPEKACLRELKEETGLKGSIINLAGVHPRRTRIYGSLIVIGYVVKVFKEDITLNDELMDAGFFRRDRLPPIPFLAHRRIIEQVFKKRF